MRMLPRKTSDQAAAGNLSAAVVPVLPLRSLLARHPRVAVLVAV